MTANTSSLRDISRAPSTRCSGTADEAAVLSLQSRTSPPETPCVRTVAAVTVPRCPCQTASPHPKGRARKVVQLTIPKAAAGRAV
jgi:hypothetical protein